MCVRASSGYTCWTGRKLLAASSGESESSPHPPNPWRIRYSLGVRGQAEAYRGRHCSGEVLLIRPRSEIPGINVPVTVPGQEGRQATPLTQAYRPILRWEGQSAAGNSPSQLPGHICQPRAMQCL